MVSNFNDLALALKTEMKIVATILAILILLMPMQPVFASVNCVVMQIERVEKCCCKKMMNCSESKKKVANRSPQRSCDKKNCPMEACTCCYYTGISRPAVEAPFVILKTQKIRLIKENILSNFISDCWRPPKIV
jgi:hypothetical protein